MYRLLSSLCLLSLLPTAHAIVIRHDRDDAKYQALAKKYQSPVCIIPSGGHGTLISENWVVTAAHVVDDVSPFKRYVVFNGRRYPVQAFYLHPSWAGSEDQQNDIALVHLAEPVKGIRPAKLYEKTDEAKKAIVFVGCGVFGDGREGPDKRDNIWRAAQNVIEATAPNRLIFNFDAPPAGSDLEGISGPGDSGGPAFWEKDGELYILGTSSRNGRREGMKACTYGTVESYGRVSTALTWLRSTMANPGKGDDIWPAPKQGLPTSTLGKIATAYVDALNAPDGSTYVAFTGQYWNPEGDTMKVSAEERKGLAEKARADFGRHTILEYVELDRRVQLLVKTEKADLMVLDLYFMKDQDKVERFRRTPARSLKLLN